MSGAIAAERLCALNSGSVATTHLAECLAVDFAALLQVVTPALAPEVLQRMRDAADKGITQRMDLAAQLLRGRDRARLRSGRLTAPTPCVAGPAI